MLDLMRTLSTHDTVGSEPHAPALPHFVRPYQEKHWKSAGTKRALAKKKKTPTSVTAAGVAQQNEKKREPFPGWMGRVFKYSHTQSIRFAIRSTRFPIVPPPPHRMPSLA